MPKYGRLSHTSEFAKVYKNAKKWHCYDASVYFWQLMSLGLQ